MGTKPWTRERQELPAEIKWGPASEAEGMEAKVTVQGTDGVGVRLWGGRWS